MMISNPAPERGFAATLVRTLALGIAVNTTVFSAFEAVLLGAHRAWTP